MSERFKWIKEQSAWRDIGILLIAVLGLLGGVGGWALAEHDEKQ